MNSLEKPSSSPLTRLTLPTKWLYAITEGIATANPATVVRSASATPGATAIILLEPDDVIPRKAFIIPITVPIRPISGDTEPITASQPRPCASSSRSSASSFSKTNRSASSWVSERPCVGRSSYPRTPGRSSLKKFTPWRNTRPYGESGSDSIAL